MNNPKTIKNFPDKVSLESGKKYFWCTCGLSGKQPFCDGTHKVAGEFKSLQFEVAETKDYFLCNFAARFARFRGCCDSRRRKDDDEHFTANGGAISRSPTRKRGAEKAR